MWSLSRYQKETPLIVSSGPADRARDACRHTALRRWRRITFTDLRPLHMCRVPGRMPYGLYTSTFSYMLQAQSHVRGEVSACMCMPTHFVCACGAVRHRVAPRLEFHRRARCCAVLRAAVTFYIALMNCSDFPRSSSPRAVLLPRRVHGVRQITD